MIEISRAVIEAARFWLCVVKALYRNVINLKRLYYLDESPNKIMSNHRMK